jgi:hypothetical protein
MSEEPIAKRMKAYKTKINHDLYRIKLQAVNLRAQRLNNQTDPNAQSR